MASMQGIRLVGADLFLTKHEVRLSVGGLISSYKHKITDSSINTVLSQEIVASIITDMHYSLSRANAGSFLNFSACVVTSVIFSHFVYYNIPRVRINME